MRGPRISYAVTTYVPCIKKKGICSLTLSRLIEKLRWNEREWARFLNTRLFIQNLERMLEHENQGFDVFFPYPVMI